MAFHPNYANNGYFSSTTPTAVVTRSSNGSPFRATRTSPPQAPCASDVHLPTVYESQRWLGLASAQSMACCTSVLVTAAALATRAIVHKTSAAKSSAKMLRINVDSLPYSNPSSNPFIGVTAMTRSGVTATATLGDAPFDSQTGELWMADVGQNAWEEINVATAGGDAAITTVGDATRRSQLQHQWLSRFKHHDVPDP